MRTTLTAPNIDGKLCQWWSRHMGDRHYTLTSGHTLVLWGSGEMEVCGCVEADHRRVVMEYRPPTANEIEEFNRPQEAA